MNLVLAEVLDKEPAAWSLAGPLLLFAIGAYCLSHWRWWFAPVLLPVAIILAWVFTSELTDSHVGPALWRESPPYFLIVSGSAVLAILAPLAGVGVCGIRRLSQGSR